MRRIGDIEGEANAKVLSDYLYVQGVENQVEAETGNVWGVWIRSEDDLEQGARLLADFRANPGAERFRQAVREAAELRADEERLDKSYRKKVHDRKETLRTVSSGPGVLTLTLIGICVAVYLLDKVAGSGALRSLYISEFQSFGGLAQKLAGLEEIRHGQFWRLFTPMFLHFGILHLVFNMMWLLDLGSLIERREGATVLLVFLLVVSCFSNLAQYIVSGPRFGGMSGVVYALLGYVWIRGKFDFRSGYSLNQSTVYMMLGWFAVCFIGLIPNVANTVHAVGLGMGMAWGYVSAYLKNN